MRWIKRGLLALLGLSLLGVTARAFVPRPVRVETGVVQRAPMRVTVDATGKARVRTRFLVSAPVGGHLARPALRAGDAVDAGQEVARIAPITPPLLDARSRTELRARLAAARAAESEARSGIERVRLAHSQALRDLERDRALLAAKVIPGQKLELSELDASARGKELAAAEAGAERARREAEALRATLALGDGRRAPGSFVSVAAPASGRVLRVLQEHEGPVPPGAPLLEIGDPRDLEVVVDLLTTQAVQVGPGAAVELLQWGGGRPLAGLVARVEPSAFTKVSSLGVEEQRVNVIVAPGATVEGWPGLSDGYHVEARIAVWQSPDALTVPASALFRRGDAWAVFAVVGGRAALRAVEVERSGRTLAAVKAGLAAGDRVILHPGDKVAEGVAVHDRP
jgi:HlyD family secretion protein